MSPGDRIPDLTLTTHRGETLRLADLRGEKAVVVYFYPQDETPICTKEACQFRDAYEDFTDAGAIVIGISADSEASHQSFAQHHRLPFHLVADEDETLRKAFGVPKFLGLLTGRVTYVIDRNGVVRHVCSARFAADRHVREALAVVQQLVADG